MKLQRTNTILYCHWWAETVAFYQDTFGFRINYQNDWLVEFELTPDSYLSIANESRATIHSVEGQGITLTWQVPGIEEAYPSLVSQNTPLTPITKKWGSQVFYLHDPEGHRIELWQPLDEAPRLISHQ
jgi:catechol 2,3-dioxygenase-like lactoylglutathione lyase family enzyme